MNTIIMKKKINDAVELDANTDNATIIETNDPSGSEINHFVGHNGLMNNKIGIIRID